MGFFGSFKRHFASVSGRPQGKPGARAYAIGDIHGRKDLLDEMIALIEHDMAATPSRENFVVFLGDLIDRGPDSAAVVERVRTYRPDNATVVVLGGNHEEVLLDILGGKTSLIEDWLRYGGAECVESYGIDPRSMARMSAEHSLRLLQETIPAEHSDFLAQLGDTFRFGDYLFVHAGIRPGIPLDEQSPRDLRWIREPFLSDLGDHDMIVVHGHTVVNAVEEQENRIAIDTGAVHSGRLTALVVEGDRRRYLATGAQGFRSGEAVTGTSFQSA